MDGRVEGGEFDFDGRAGGLTHLEALAGPEQAPRLARRCAQSDQRGVDVAGADIRHDQRLVFSRIGSADEDFQHRALLGDDRHDPCESNGPRSPIDHDGAVVGGPEPVIARGGSCAAGKQSCCRDRSGEQSRSHSPARCGARIASTLIAVP